MIGLYKKIPPKLFTPFFYTFITVGYILRFLFQTPYGLFILVIGLYFYVCKFTSITPLNAKELLDWLNNLGSEYKVALLASSVTVAGFAVAFHTATINWRNQMKAQLMLTTAAEIENFFALVLRNVTTVELHIRSLVETVNLIQNSEPKIVAEFKVNYLVNQTNKFLDARTLLSEASVEVHRLISKNYNILASNWGSLESVQTSANALKDITDKMWVQLPILNLEDPQKLQSFAHQINIVKCNDFIATCNRCTGVISGLIGSVGGQLLSPVIGFNYSMFRTLIRNKKSFSVVMTELHEKINKS